MTEVPATAPYGPPLLIANPNAGNDRGSVLRAASAELHALGVDHDVAETTAAGDASMIAREAVRAGRRFVVAVGGDGTIHEVVNGLVDAESGTPHAPDTVLGILPGGSGGDLARTFGFDRRPGRAVRHLLGDTVNAFDVGRVRLTGPDGRPRTVLFANIAEAGYGGTVVRLASRLPRRLGQSRYAVATVAAIARFRLVETTITLDSSARTEPLSNVVVANGQFFGGGMNVAPRALPWDGRFNVQAWTGTPVDVLRAGPSLRHGTHTSRADVREWNSTTVAVDGPPLVVEADGEVLGTTPATFDLLPGALRIKL
ncbi:MAG: YegS/Rv2252/BmrU family lipid kinase [Nitriliruptor sp.]